MVVMEAGIEFFKELRSRCRWVENFIWKWGEAEETKVNDKRFYMQSFYVDFTCHRMKRENEVQFQPMAIISAELCMSLSRCSLKDPQNAPIVITLLGRQSWVPAATKCTPPNWCSGFVGSIKCYLSTTQSVDQRAACLSFNDCVIHQIFFVSN